MDPYRPAPEPPPPRRVWRVGDRVVVRYRPTTRTLLTSLEGQRGTVVEEAHLDYEGNLDECVLVRFEGDAAWEACDPKVRRFLGRHEGHVRRLWTDTSVGRWTTCWFFAGDLDE